MILMRIERTHHYTRTGGEECTLKISTADLCDHYSDRADLGLQVALPGLQSFGGHDCLFGPAYTISCIDDSGLIRETVATPGERRILVVDGHASTRRALLGDIQAARALDNGWGGIVIHGCVRDRLALASLPFAIFAIGTVPLRPLRAGSGQVGGEVSFLNVTIRPGTWVYADPDGMIVMNQAVEIPTPIPVE
jgi:regulator of ribonuclease activity A